MVSARIRANSFFMIPQSPFYIFIHRTQRRTSCQCLPKKAGKRRPIYLPLPTRQRKTAASARMQKGPRSKSRPIYGLYNFMVEVDPGRRGTGATLVIITDFFGSLKDLFRRPSRKKARPGRSPAVQHVILLFLTRTFLPQFSASEGSPWYPQGPWHSLDPCPPDSDTPF